MATYSKLLDQKNNPLLLQDGGYIYLNPLTSLWQFLTKHVSSFSPLSKHITQWTSKLKSGFYQLLTEANNYLMQENDNYIVEEQTDESSWNTQSKSN